MRRINLGLLVVVVLLIAIGVIMSYFKSIKKELSPKKIIAKSTFGKEGRGLGEFISPGGVAIKGDYLFVADLGNSRIQVLKINPDGSLFPKFSFGKEGKGLGEFESPISLAVKRN